MPRLHTVPTRLCSSLLLTLAALPLFAQTHSAAPPATYDVVSIHEHDPADPNRRWRTLPDGTTMVNVSLQLLASMAYNIKPDLVSGGPAWATTRGFDLTAKALPGEDGKPRQIDDAQHQALLRALLDDRFHLVARVETNTLPVYELVLAKGGTKMKPAPAPPPPPESPTVLPDLSHKPRGLAEFGPGYLRATSYAVSGLADQLGSVVGKTVIDKTGLSGFFDLDLEYSPQDPSASPAQPKDAAEPKPDLFTALQEQLGLKLVPARGPVRSLVIDSADLPAPN